MRIAALGPWCFEDVRGFSHCLGVARLVAPFLPRT